MLWPCHWRFLQNLEIVLKAIGGNLNPNKPFAACGRNIGLSPIKQRVEIISSTLKAFYNSHDSKNEIDRDMLTVLGEPSKRKRWLAASLDKTIRLQINPPAEFRNILRLPMPEWIDE